MTSTEKTSHFGSELIVACMLREVDQTIRSRTRLNPTFRREDRHSTSLRDESSIESVIILVLKNVCTWVTRKAKLLVFAPLPPLMSVQGTHE